MTNIPDLQTKTTFGICFYIFVTKFQNSKWPPNFHDPLISRGTHADRPGKCCTRGKQVFLILFFPGADTGGGTRGLSHDQIFEIVRTSRCSVHKFELVLISY